MQLKEKIKNDLKQAMKSREAETVSALRFVLSEIKRREIDERSEANDVKVLEVLSREIKKMNDAILEFKKGKRADLIEKEEKNKKILDKYLPAQLNEAEANKIIKEALEKTGASSEQDLGKVMKEIMPKIKGRFDGKKVNELVRANLNK
jgi:uncharacterized protein YqeY